MDNYTFFKSLHETTKTKEKKYILADATEDQKLLLYFALNPQITFGVKTITVGPTRAMLLNPMNEFCNLIVQLQTRTLTGNAAAAAVSYFFASVSGKDREVFSRILLREPIGVDAATVNAVYPGYIPAYSLLLAPSKSAVLEDLSYPKIVQPKLDGFRCTCTFKPNETEVSKRTVLLSRTGKPIRNTIVRDQIDQYLVSLNIASDVVLDGELYKHGWKFKRISAAATKKTDNPNKQYPDDCYNLQFVVWDAMSLVEWDGRYSLEYINRIDNVNSLLRTSSTTDRVHSISRAFSVVSFSPEDSKRLHDDAVQMGFEGIMLKSHDHSYKWKRCTPKEETILKYKEFKSIDLEVIGSYEGKGDNKGRLGGFTVEYKGNTVDVGSGFDEDEVISFWVNPEQYVGKIIEIQYQEETEDKEGRPSLRFPVFKGFRDDKEIADEE